MNDLNWRNFDRVSELIESEAEKADATIKRKEANDALGQLFGITEKGKEVFRTLNTDQQNMFLEHVVKQSEQGGRNATSATQAVLEGLRIKAPAVRGPSAPALGMVMAPPVPGGMGGGNGGMVPPQQPVQYVPQQPVDDTPPWLK